MYKRQVPVLRGSAGNVTTLPETDWGITVDAWTLEAGVRMDGYGINNQAIFTSGSNDHEIYIRFGDANRPYNLSLIHIYMCIRDRLQTELRVNRLKCLM